MSNELSHALLSVIQQASESDVIGPNAIRAKRMADASNELIVLADVSGSMSDVIGSSGMSKHHHLGIALADVRKYHPEAKVLAFASSARFLTAKDSRLPQPGSMLGFGTNLANALREAATLKPRKTIVISDGLPDDESAALAEAAQITGIIDTISGWINSPTINYSTSAKRCARSLRSEIHSSGKPHRPRS